MAQQDADRLIEAAKSNPKIREKLNAAGRDGLKKAAKALGYDVDIHELERALKAHIVRTDLVSGPNAVLSSVTINVSIV